MKILRFLYGNKKQMLLNEILSQEVSQVIADHISENLIRNSPTFFEDVIISHEKQRKKSKRKRKYQRNKHNAEVKI